ncbi:hypothetical protein MUO14_07220 [Halobacillus shinanisalinarum]|uniref:Glycoside hydrolase family 33 N-terminal domain-containing protein n=1 Tax=Halobacillus shinanisalinarum TaxID=2932258 RepID=A0ABY4H3M4_9BACI|nr:sialidase domain-containing protein [Halobacillus shinanisalinarum]UOQ94725.1 hypothetical protein MUO14_07220 [Halobacillus shinanisalinarum]
MFRKMGLFGLSILLTLITFHQTSQVNAESSGKPEPIVRVENQQISDGNYTNLNARVDELKELEEGTIIVRFRYTGSSIMSLFSLSNTNLADSHFHLYITPTSVGSENRYEKPGEEKENIHIKATPVDLKEGNVHTLAMVVDKEKGYKYFLDGELIKKDTESPRKFLSNIYNPNNAQLGRTERASGGNPYLFSGISVFLKFTMNPFQKIH